MTNLKNFFSPGHLSRACPHRFCRPLHRVFLTLMALGFLTMLTGPILFSIGMILLVASMVWLIYGLRYSRFRAGDSSGDTPPGAVEKVLAATEDHSPLAHWYGVRTGWARTAAVMDVVYVLMGIIFLFGSLQNVGQFTATPEGGFSWHAVVAILAGVGIAAFTVYAHYKATAPTRPATERSWRGRLAPQVS